MLDKKNSGVQVVLERWKDRLKQNLWHKDKCLQETIETKRF